MKIRHLYELKSPLYIVVFIIVLFLFWNTSAESFASLLITEFMASNGSIILDQSGKLNDWIEIHNTSSQPIDISGYFISDKLDDPLKWQIPEGYHQETIIPDGGFIVLIADGKPDHGPLHLDFELSKTGEHYLTEPDGTQPLMSSPLVHSERCLLWEVNNESETWVFFHLPQEILIREQNRFLLIAGLYLFYKSYRNFSLPFAF